MIFQLHILQKKKKFMSRKRTEFNMEAFFPSLHFTVLNLLSSAEMPAEKCSLKGKIPTCCASFSL